MELDQKSRVETFAFWLAGTKFGAYVFSRRVLTIILLTSFLLFTQGLYWATAWWSPWPYIMFMFSGMWFGQGVFKQFSLIIKQSMEQEWDSLIFKISLPFILVNHIALFACFYTFGIVLENGEPITGMWRHFYFSAVTLTTLGYGNIVPGNMLAEMLATIESLIGFMAFAVLAGIVGSIAYKRVGIGRDA